jgi:hypothetical protein
MAYGVPVPVPMVKIPYFMKNPETLLVCHASNMMKKAYE